MLLTSKDAAGVAGGGFIALKATLSMLGTVPVAGIMLIFGIDKFMSECRALVNFYGNAVATLVVAKWNKTLDVDQARQVLATHTAPELVSSVDNEDAARAGTGHDRPSATVTAEEIDLTLDANATTLEPAIR